MATFSGVQAGCIPGVYEIWERGGRGGGGRHVGTEWLPTFKSIGCLEYLVNFKPTAIHI